MSQSVALKTPTRPKRTRVCNNRRPHQGDVHKDDPGLTGRDHVTRLDPLFNHQYIQLCYEERLRYVRQQSANA